MTEITNWICEFCFKVYDGDRLPDDWDFIFQSAVCPECKPKVQVDGGYQVVKGGAYAKTGEWAGRDRRVRKIMDNQKHQCSEFRWEMCVNENGWKCMQCGEPSTACDPPGFDPFLDKNNIQGKVMDILDFLHEAKIIHISNGTGGDIMTEMVVNRCRNENRFDQSNIARFVMELEHPGQQDYWRKIGMGVRDGRDPRDRCECGQLATMWSGDKRYCTEHTRDALTAKA